MLIQKALSKLRLRNGDDVFLMVEYELNNKLFVKILNLKRNEVYVGHSNDIELRSQAARIRLTFDEFTEKIIKALVENASDNSNFLYCLDEQDGMYKFQWKSIDEEQTIISLGSVDVRKESFAITLTDMLEMISIEMRLMRNKIQELNADIDRTQNQSSDALEQLRLATEMKEKLEKEMYSKFVLVLNEKKRKIRELQQKNKHNSHSGNTEFQKKKPKKSSKPLVSDSSDELDDIDEPGPSAAKTDTSFSFLDDDKSILPTTRNRIRNRKVLASKKENGNKSTFINCNQSSKNITVDDDESDEHLFDNL
ncbi:hypothetical protein AVEN_144693-1 [Araneus ventricosus]|uniref:DNA repair protein XRCC4 n=1 Tax=Araneus ventricosus TaxID=182803 RepID=A0A4Y2I6R0_ARAVE|nr:hypothetical protein AVEN_144693-1 [Araneus ventricosus]